MNPLVAALLAVLLSVGGATYWFGAQTKRLVALAVEHRAASIEAKRPEKPWDFWTPEMEQVAKELNERRTALTRREAELTAWEGRLAGERKELDAMRKQVEALRSEIDHRLVQVEAQELKNLKSLVATYSRLTPTAAVAIFGQMDDLLVAKILSLMKPETASAILQELGSQPGPDGANLKRAAELTQRLRLLVPATPPAR